MCHNIRNWRAAYANKTKTQVRLVTQLLSKYEVSPSLANVREFVPIPSSDTKATLRGLVFVYKSRSIKTKYVKKRTMVEDVDRCSMWTVAGGPLTC